ncbi:MAG: hypothetical protein IJM29_02665 [Bacteroidales bacterium]|nr:hypothetical protein [Bacteroidales bacterium]
MDEKEYIQSYGFQPEDLTEDELQQVRNELQAIQSGKIILDGVLAFKIIAPSSGSSVSNDIRTLK